MKDNYAREQIKELEIELGSRIMDLERKLSKFIVRHCPKCKHDTMQVVEWDSNSSTCTYYISRPPPLDSYRCLNCGSRIECETKEICEIKGAK